MKNKVFKLIVILIIFFLGINTNVFTNNIVLADEGSEDSYNFNNIDPSQWKPEATEVNEGAFSKKIGKVLKVIRNIGITISVVALMYIGLRTMYGSIEDKSYYKELMPSFIIGVIILLLCTTIPNIIYEVASTFNDI